MKRTRALLAFTLLATAAARAEDRIELKSGTSVRGIIESETATEFILRVGRETYPVPKRVVTKVVRDPEVSDADRAPRPRAAPVAPPVPPAETAVSAPAAGSKEEKPADPVSAGPVATNQGVGAPEAKPAAASAAESNDALLSAISSGTSEEVAAAQAILVAAWPANLGTLRAALVHSSVAVRREAVLLIDRSELAGSESLILDACKDKDPSVRQAAVRAVRTKSLRDAEPLLVSMLVSELVANVKLEVVRSLEDVGTAACLQPVLDALEFEREPKHRRPYLRVLRKLTGEDHGDDLAKWRDAVWVARQRAARAAR